MKLEKLIIHNIASIEDAQIDFSQSPLSDSSIFLITGKTGSGKTTILDSISLALYGAIPRLKSTNIEGGVQEGDKEIRVNDPRVLMRRNTSECFVNLTFIGNDNKLYQAEWACKRSRSIVEGKLQSKTRQLLNLSDDLLYVKDKEIDEVIKKIIGLDFEQFLRTVMLSQGEFTRFLNSKDNEKAEILEKLTGIDIYSKIGKKIFELTREKKQNKDILQATLNKFPDLNPQEQIEKQEKLKELSKTYDIQKQIFDDNSKKSQWIDAFQKLEKDYSTIMEKWQENQKIIQSEVFKKNENSIRIWQETINVRHKISRILELKATKQQLLQRLCRYEEEFQRLVCGYRYLKNEKDAKQIELTNLSTLLSGQKNQQEIAEFLTNLNLLKQCLESEKKNKEKIEKNKEKIEKIKEKISKNKEKISQDLALRLNALKSEYNKAKELYEKQKDSIDKFAINLRQTLKIGDICPLCLQRIENSLPIEEELYEVVNTLKENYEICEKNYKNLQQEIENLSAQIETNQKIYNQEKEELEKDTSLQDCEKQILELREKCGFNSEEIEENSIEIAAENARQILKKIDKYNELKREFELLKMECENAKNIFLNIILQMPEWKKQSKTEVERIDNLQTKLNGFHSDLKTTINKLNDCNKETMDLEGAIEAFLQENKEYTREKLELINSVAETRIRDIEKEVNKRKEINISLSANKETLEKNIENHNRNKPKIEAVETKQEIDARLKDLEYSLGEINRQKGALEKDIELSQKNIQEREKLSQEYNKAEKEFLKWDKLNSFIGDSLGVKFRKIAQSYVLSNLINSANYHLKTLTDRYKLRVIPGTFVIELEDAYNGFTSRPVTTISGGESFLVSLSLALALSDIGANLSLDTLFIDEGFGTLSKDVLQTVMQTLSLLHKTTGKKVGIISHVEELQERIPVQIQVKQEGYSSSSKVSIIG